MIKWLLSNLLHHANRVTKTEEFYRIKDRILTKYGKVVGHDVQFLEGIKCRSCRGKGFHYRYGYGHYNNTADCYHCFGGWYKHPTWVLLQRIQFGRYIFHKPLQKEIRFKNNPFTKEAGWDVTEEVITGLIYHTKTKHGKDALIILYLLYDWNGYWKRWYKAIGRGWRCSKYWWLRPRNWPNNIAHIIRYRTKAKAFMKMKKWVPPFQEPDPDTSLIPTGSPIPPDDLPF